MGAKIIGARHGTNGHPGREWTQTEQTEAPDHVRRLRV